MDKEHLIKLLKERGIELDIDGCGCCGSPLIWFKIDGEEYSSEGKPLTVKEGE